MEDSNYCNHVRDISLNGKELFQEFSVTILLLGLAVINILLHYINTKVITRFSAYIHLSPDTNEEICVRCMQLLFGILIAISGYGFLLYNAASGCNANEIFLFYLGGLWLVAFDAHEFVRRWPLRPALLAHHVTVFIVGLAFTEWGVLPSDSNEPVQWTVVLLLANIGVGWVTDFFHVIFRTSSGLRVIQTSQLIYLCLAVVRLINMGLFVTMIGHAAADESYLGVATTTFLALAYTYNTYKAVSFVKNFDCEKYFMNHQVEWESKSSELDMCHQVAERVGQPPLQRRYTSVEDARTRRVSFAREPCLAVSEGSFGLGILTERRASVVQEGLRGDSSLEQELREYLKP